MKIFITSFIFKYKFFLKILLGDYIQNKMNESTL